MEITFLDPGAEEMIRQILECQTEGETAFWSEPLYFVYPQLDRAYAKSLSFDGRKDYIRQVLLRCTRKRRGSSGKRPFSMPAIGRAASPRSPPL